MHYIITGPIQDGQQAFTDSVLGLSSANNDFDERIVWEECPSVGNARQILRSKLDAIAAEVPGFDPEAARTEIDEQNTLTIEGHITLTIIEGSHE